MCDNNINKLINELRRKYLNPAEINQIEIDADYLIIKDYKDELRPNECDEILEIVDNNGMTIQKKAPRWFCHLLGLKHRSVHVLLEWNSPMLGKVFIFQIRSWKKSDSPGLLDISVGGHVIGNGKSISYISAYKEMYEELGIKKDDLKNGQLIYKKSYEFKEEREVEKFYNYEWREVYSGIIETQKFDRICFKENEVVGLYLCPKNIALQILDQSFIPIASALRYSLPYCI